MLLTLNRARMMLMKEAPDTTIIREKLAKERQNARKHVKETVKNTHVGGDDLNHYAKPVVKKAGGKYVKSTEQGAVHKRSRTIAVIPLKNDVNSMLVNLKRPGQPTKYRKQYCDLIIRYFTEAEPVVKIVDDPGGKGGTQTKYETLRVPTIRGFAARIGVTHKTLYNWCDEHVEFLHAFERACALQDAIVEELGLAGRLGKGLAELYFMNRLEYRDSRHMDVTSNGAPLPTPITALQLNVNAQQAQLPPQASE